MVPAAVLLLLGLVFGPMAYVRWIMARHGADRPDLPGTGGELARHLLDEAGLHHVAVEPTDEGDRYDPAAPAVRLSPEHLDGRSVTAVAVAAHEVAHAVQHRDGARLFGLRLALMRIVVPLRAVAIALMTVLPFGGAVAGAGHLVLPSILLAVAVFGLSILVQMVTLPLEFDASFTRALPAIDRGGYLAGPDVAAARSVLWAAALTYLASALLSLLQLTRVVR
ncbi:zinc metallopeptidase [Roseomonas sp. PWR1]|uniref:Zinc metallopeptidase n=1 Tax=Roseomonas nitratireducens TaxID=2820810 RepID=A0ABS4AP85_9PROT|nr:zinc metallopeptidase [Neoroseomonas nitratireducens]MBP0463172.1 zinc metallopeptidase [Neoroseomonas nitratireducens]